MAALLESRQLVVAWLVMVTLSWTAVADERDRFGTYSVRPFVELQPGFTTDARQVFTLDIGGVGREPIDIHAIAINDRILPRDRWRTHLNRLTISPDQDLRVGLNRISVRYDHRIDRMHRDDANPIVQTFFVNRQSAAPRVTFGDRGELIVGGKRLFVRAGYRSGQVDEFVEALPSAAAGGFNLVHDYRFESYDLQRLGVGRFVKDARTYLRRAHELGLGVFLGLPRAALREYDEPALAAIVSELANEPALWMWYLYDEPSESTLGVAAASRAYALLRRIDPGRPSIMLTNSVSTLLQYHPFCDVLWYDRYPIVATSDELSSLAPIAAAIGKAMQTVAPGKPVWPVLQAHDNKGSPSLRKRSPLLTKPSDTTHRPNEAEIRAQAHLAIAQGTMAVAYYWGPQSWYSMKTDTPGIWNSLTRVIHELRDIESVLLSDQPVPALDVAGGHDKVMMWIRSYHGEVYVGVVNASLHVPAELSIRATTQSGRVRRVQGDGKIVSGGGRVSVELGPAGVAVLAFPSP